MVTKEDRKLMLVNDLMEDVELLVKRMQQGSVRNDFERRMAKFMAERDELFPPAVEDSRAARMDMEAEYEAEDDEAEGDEVVAGTA